MNSEKATTVRDLFPSLRRKPIEAARIEPVLEPTLIVTIRHGVVQSAVLDGEPVKTLVRDYDAAIRRRKAFEELDFDDNGDRFLEAIVSTDG